MTNAITNEQLYENYNALFFNASDENTPKVRYELFDLYISNTDFNNFITLMKNVDVTADSYKLWIKTWKNNYKHLVRAIRLTKHYRKPGNITATGFKGKYGNDWAAAVMNSRRKFLRQVAFEMLELRVSAKESRKAYLVAQHENSEVAA